jgi:4-amino-4-deoxy-L-arabinose transferase-like glycosyltransferase
MQRSLLAIVLLGFLLRLAALALVYPTAPIGEEEVHSARASDWNANLSVSSDQVRAPGIIFFFTILSKTIGHNPIVFRFGNLVLGVLFLPLFHRWARRIVEPRIALLATLLVAVHPEMVLYSVSLWSEPLYLLLVYTAFALSWSICRPPVPARALVLGVLVALATLTRETALFLIPMIVVDYLIELRSSFRRRVAVSALFLCTCAITVLPWSIPLSQRSDRFVLITGMNELRLFVGNAPPPARVPEGWNLGKHIWYATKVYESLSESPRERPSLARKATLQTIRDRLPWWPLEKVRDEIPSLLTPNSFPAARFFAQPEEPWGRLWAFHFSSQELDRKLVGQALGMLTVGVHMITTLAGTLGLALLPLKNRAFPLLAFGVAHVAPTIVAFACSRYRIPLTPIFLLGAAALFANGGLLWRQASHRRRFAAIGALVLAAIILLSRIDRVLPAQYGATTASWTMV